MSTGEILENEEATANGAHADGDDLANRILAMGANELREMLARRPWMVREMNYAMEFEENHPEFANRPVVDEDMRMPDCVCERCPELFGEDSRCCQRSAQNCLSNKRFLKRILMKEATTDRSEEAERLGVTEAESHRYHCYRLLWARYKDIFNQWPRLKMPNCVEEMVHEAFPSNQYRGFKFRQEESSSDEDEQSQPQNGSSDDRRRIIGGRLC